MAAIGGIHGLEITSGEVFKLVLQHRDGIEETSEGIYESQRRSIEYLAGNRSGDVWRAVV
jgi:hypothetical protein